MTEIEITTTWTVEELAKMLPAVDADYAELKAFVLQRYDALVAIKSSCDTFWRDVSAQALIKMSMTWRKNDHTEIAARDTDHIRVLAAAAKKLRPWDKFGPKL